MNERIYFQWNGERKYILLHEMQSLFNCLSAEQPQHEYRNLLQMFIHSNDNIERETARIQEDRNNQIIEKDIE